MKEELRKQINEWRENGEYEKIINKVLELDEKQELEADDINILDELAKNLEDAGKHEESIWVLGQIGWTLGSMGDYEKALEYLKKAEEEEKDSPWLLSQIGWNLNKMGRCEEALEYLKKAEELGRNDAWLLCEIGWSYGELGQNKEAADYMLKAEELGRNDEWLYYEIGWNLGRTGEFERAVEYLTKAEEMSTPETNLISLYSELGWNYRLMGEYEISLEYVKRAEELGRDDTWLNFQIGYNLVRLGNTGEGLNYLYKSENQGGQNNISLLSEIGYVLGQLERCEEAAGYLERAEKLGRNDIWIYSEIGWDFGGMGKYEEAMEYFEKVVEMGRDDSWINLQIAWCLSRMNKDEEAVDYYLKGKELSTGTDEWLEYNLGVSYRKLGKYSEALECQNKVLEMGAYRGWVHLELADIYAEIGERDKALEYLKDVKVYLNMEDEDVNKKYLEVENKIYSVQTILS